MACVLGSGEEDCYTKIASGEADLSAFDGGSIFDAGKVQRTSYSLIVESSQTTSVTLFRYFWWVSSTGRGGLAKFCFQKQ